MIVGINYPVAKNLQGAQIGPYPHVDSLNTWVSEQYRAARGDFVKWPPQFENIDRNLDILYRMGIRVVRWFMVGNGLVYGPAPTARASIVKSAPIVTPANFKVTSWEFMPPTSLDVRFAAYFEEILNRFRMANDRAKKAAEENAKKSGVALSKPPEKIQIIPSFIDFFFGGNRANETARVLQEAGLAAGGRTDCIQDENKRHIFLSTLLSTLMNISVRYEDVIYAWEVINEPFWMLDNVANFLSQLVNMNPLGSDIRVTQNVMASFLDEALSTIESRTAFKERSTVGHRFYSNINKGSASFLSPNLPPGKLPQFHYYAESGTLGLDPPQIKGQKLFSGSPKPFLGEFDSDFDRFGDRWPELKGGGNTLERLKLLQDEGCDLALIWPDYGGAKDGHARADLLKSEDEMVVKYDPIKLQNNTRDAIAKFTGGVASPIELEWKKP